MPGEGFGGGFGEGGQAAEIEVAFVQGKRGGDVGWQRGEAVEPQAAFHFRKRGGGGERERGEAAEVEYPAMRGEHFRRGVGERGDAAEVEVLPEAGKEHGGARLDAGEGAQREAVDALAVRLHEFQSQHGFCVAHRGRVSAGVRDFQGMRMGTLGVHVCFD